ncbi:MAG TPA: carotenoid oxygenase family protein [Candidatus Binataceae bacterium]|nr:carotenoid oxygenase family protein [Candidatus Binataceae bacterium]
MWKSDNPFLNGNYAPWREEGDAYDLEVDGEIPRDLSGVLYRVGPNPHFKPRGRYHWFDGDGMVHGFILKEGRAAYRNRYVKTEGLRAEMKAGHSLYGGLVEQLGDIPSGLPPFKNAANTNIVGYANRLLALYEAGLPHELTPLTLETVGLFDFGGKLNGPMTAHPKVDPETGDLLFFGYQPFPPYLIFYRADSTGKLLESRPIDSGLPAMIHDFVATSNYAIFFICPSVFRLENAAQGKPLFVWEPEHGTRIGVMSRASGAVQWFRSEPFFIFHFLNAYEENGKILIDGCRMDSLDMSGEDFGSTPFPWRWTLDLKQNSMSSEQLEEFASEFPRFDERIAGERHRYGYLAASRTSKREFGFNCVIKRDYDTGRTEFQEFGGNKFPGEPVFVPRSAASAEDGGWVLTVWYDPAADSTELSIQEACNFSSAPVARIKAPHRVPFGFHGNWVPA